MLYVVRSHTQRLLNLYSSDFLKSTIGRKKLYCSQSISSQSNREYSSGTYAWSYVAAPGSSPLLGLTVGQVINRAEGLYGDCEAIVSSHQNIRRTFTEFKKEVDRIAAGFSAVGMNHGDSIGIWGPNSYEWIVTQFAAAKAGLILVNINPAYRLDEIQYCLNKVAVKGIVCDKSFKTSEYYKMLCELAPSLHSSRPGDLVSKELPHLKTVIVNHDEHLSGTFRFQDLYDAGESTHYNMINQLESKIQFDDPCNIQFTSGTTGNPKGAVLSHHGIVNNAVNIGRRLEYGKKPHRVCLPVPLFHCFGCVAGIMVGTLYGTTSVMPSAGFDAEAVMRDLANERITSCYGTPTMFVDILNASREKNVDLSSLSTGVMAGAPCPPELVKAVMTELNMKDFVVLYGMTETSPVTFQCFPSDEPEVRATTVGYPLDHTEVKVVDNQGHVVPTGESGELLIRGYCNFLGYWDDEEKTKEVFTSDHWLKTGDLAIIQPNGYGRIVGRIKDMIIRGGENISPVELENFLMTHPEVAEVQVVGIPDKRMGEEVAAWVRCISGSRLSEKELKDWCKGKIAHFKIPRYIIFRDDFPKTASGKIQKFKIREMTVRELGLEH